MSYSVNNTCWNCKKEKECTDHVKIRDAVQEIHKNCLGQGGHLGSGNIIIHCARCDAKEK